MELKTIIAGRVRISPTSLPLPTSEAEDRNHIMNVLMQAAMNRAALAKKKGISEYDMGRIENELESQGMTKHQIWTATKHLLESEV